jgi:hypothetical protein
VLVALGHLTCQASLSSQRVQCVEIADRGSGFSNSLSAERHCDLIRAGQCAGFTDLVYVGDLAPAPGGVGMEAVVCRRRPHNPIAVNIDLARSSATP